VKSTRGAEIRLRIIQAAPELFNKQGVGAISPDQIIGVLAEVWIDSGFDLA